MKKIFAFVLALCLTTPIILPAHAHTSTNDFTLLSGYNGQFGYKVTNETPLTRSSTDLTEIKEFSNGVEISTPINYFTKNGDIKISLDLPEGAHLSYMSNLETEDDTDTDAILILDDEDNLLGIIDRTYIITTDGKEIEATQTIVNENTIIPSYDENISSGTMVSVLAASLNYYQYFEYLTYDNYSFELKARLLNINSLSTSVSNADVLLWNSANSEGSALYGSSWSNYVDTLRKQFDCHYLGRQYAVNLQGEEEGSKWNLEPSRTATSYFDYLFNKCNP